MVGGRCAREVFELQAQAVEVGVLEPVGRRRGDGDGFHLPVRLPFEERLVEKPEPDAVPPFLRPEADHRSLELPPRGQVNVQGKVPLGDEEFSRFRLVHLHVPAQVVK